MLVCQVHFCTRSYKTAPRGYHFFTHELSEPLIRIGEYRNCSDGRCCNMHPKLAIIAQDLRGFLIPFLSFEVSSWLLTVAILEDMHSGS